MLLVLTVAGLILYSQATDPSVGRLAVFAGIAVAGAISGISGLAFPLIAGPIFLLMYPAPEAVALTAMCSLTAASAAGSTPIWPGPNCALLSNAHAWRRHHSGLS
jgi:hypothetical protein